MKHINENGRSMVEMLGVLAIIGVLSVGGIAGYSKAMNKYKINKTTDQISMLVANIRTLFSSQGDYAGLTNEQAKKFGVVPNEMYSDESDSEITNAFGGAVLITASKAREADAGTEAFTIEYAGLSSEACVTIATGDWGSGQSSGLIAIAAGKEDDAPAGVTLGTVGTSLGEVTIDEAASSAAAGDGSVVAKPGDTTVPTPVTVTQAVAACSGGANSGSGYAVAWKYY